MVALTLPITSVGLSFRSGGVYVLDRLGSLTRPAWIRFMLLVVAFAAIYLCADVALNRLAFSSGWTTLWPLNGVTIALLLMRPRRDWPAMLLGIAAGTGAGEYTDGNGLGSEVLQRLISILEVLLSACVLPAFTSLDEWLRQPGIQRRFYLALLLGPGIAGVMAAVLFHHLQGQSYLSAWNDWATADALGIAATMPLSLALGSVEMRRLFRQRALLKTAGVLTLAVASILLIFFASEYPLLFLLYPILLLVDVLLGFAGSAMVMPVACLVAVYCETNAHGPFGHWPAQVLVPSNMGLQIYLGFQIVALFPASILFRERARLAVELGDRNAQLAMLAATDGLTGIANRRSFDERFTQAWNHALCGQSPMALLMIDVDQFKQFNDVYGHHAGDKGLQAVARILLAQVSRPCDLAARFGGEEFAVLLRDTTPERADVVAKGICRAIYGLGIPHEGSSCARLTVSIGGAAFTPQIDQEPFDLLKLADAALYRAKRDGRNCVRVGSPSAAVCVEKAHSPSLIEIGYPGVFLDTGGRLRDA